jgi:hypothetical protein
VLAAVQFSRNLSKDVRGIILPVVLCGWGTLSLTFREEHRLEVFETWILRRICRPKRDEMRGWRRLHNEYFHNLYSWPNITGMFKQRRVILSSMWRRGVHKELIISMIFDTHTRYEALYYAIVSNLLLFQLPSIQIFFSAPCASFNVRDHVSHPYKTTGKVTVLCIVIFTFSDRRGEW